MFLSIAFSNQTQSDAPVEEYLPEVPRSRTTSGGGPRVSTARQKVIFPLHKLKQDSKHYQLALWIAALKSAAGEPWTAKLLEVLSFIIKLPVYSYLIFVLPLF